MVDTSEETINLLGNPIFLTEKEEGHFVQWIVVLHTCERTKKFLEEHSLYHLHPEKAEIEYDYPINLN